MEESIFPAPAVAEVLREHYVEARLHMDVDEVREKYHDLQDRLVGTLAVPVYVLLDPVTGKVLDRHYGWLPSEGGFAAFLEKPLSQ